MISKTKKTTNTTSTTKNWVTEAPAYRKTCSNRNRRVDFVTQYNNSILRMAEAPAYRQLYPNRKGRFRLSGEKDEDFCASESRGVDRPETMDPPEQSNRPWYPKDEEEYKSDNTKNPMISTGSLGPSSTDDLPTPELEAPPWRHGKVGRGTEKRCPSYTPKNHVGNKASENQNSIEISGLPSSSLSSYAVPFFPATGTPLPLTIEPLINEQLSEDSRSPSSHSMLPLRAAETSPSATSICPCNDANIPEGQPTFQAPALPKPSSFCLQWNVNGFFNNLGDIELLTAEDPPWVLALQEVNKVTTDQLNHSVDDMNGSLNLEAIFDTP